jgi:hypothetical protein
MQSSRPARALVLFTYLVVGIGCGDESSRHGSPEDASADPCAPPGCDGAAQAGSADASGDAADAGNDPCSEAQGPVYDLCLWARAEDLQALDADPKARLEVPAEVSLVGQRYGAVQLELHGGTARTFEKKSYRVRFADDHPEFDFFGDGEHKEERLVLQASWIDQTFVRAKLVMDLVRELGGLAPRVGYARLHVNGKYQGLYQVIERVDEHYLERNGFARDGNLYKAENHAADFGVHDDPLAGFAEITHEDMQADDLAELFQACMTTEQTHAAFEQSVAPRVSLEDFQIWYLVMSYALNLDTFSKNYYLYHDPQAQDPEHGSAFRIIHWDADTSFGMWWDGTRWKEPGSAELYGQRNKFAPRLFAITEYRQAYLERFRELLGSTFASERVLTRARQLLDVLEPYIVEERERWKRSGAWDDERAYLEETIVLRSEVMTKAVNAAFGTR